MLLKANINYHIHRNSPLVVPVPNQMNPVYNLTHYFFTFISLLPSALNIVLATPVQTSYNTF